MMHNCCFLGRRNVDNLYTQVTQRRTLSGILGEEVVDRLYSLHANAFLARGHLMANTDNIFGSQMRASFYFINAQPQWQVFNGKNDSTFSILNITAMNVSP